MIHDRLKKKQTIAMILTIIIVFAIAFTGCSNDKTTKVPHRNGSPYKNQLIAVVNQDAGVEYSGRTINYSDEFIKTLDENCILNLIFTIDTHNFI